MKIIRVLALFSLVIALILLAQAAAAMEVAVGQFQDPVELPGLAHFCEHMLFLGTEKYPDENSYSAFLSSHGGSSNGVLRASKIAVSQSLKSSPPFLSSVHE